MCIYVLCVYMWEWVDMHMYVWVWRCCSTFERLGFCGDCYILVYSCFILFLSPILFLYMFSFFLCRRTSIRTFELCLELAYIVKKIMARHLKGKVR